MSVQAMSWAFAQDIDVPGAKLVLLALANYTSNEHGDCFPGQERLARDTSQGVRTVRRHLSWLETNQYIERAQRRRKDGSRTSDHIILCLDRDNRPDLPLADQPAKNDTSSGQIVHESPANLAGHEPLEEPLEEPSDSAREQIPFSHLVNIWNEHCGKCINTVLKLSPGRKTHLAARFRNDFGGDPDAWRAYCQRIAASRFLSSKPGPWMSFDWAINPNNCIKVREGKYDDAPAALPRRQDATPGHAHSMESLKEQGLIS